ncbi:hypothetical protein PT974_08009 [Cladobotryum mycophilum]|uniref:Secreted protein n=1 Tax=Cladobotryum mycophilum TaxID=491253 RepID=A0ABR0SCQ0_9HYPO
MRFFNYALMVAATAAAQRPTDTPICDYYTTALLKDNTAENQAALLTVLVNTVVIGNYTMPNVGIKVPGILAPGKVGSEDVNLLPYFTGDLASTNRGGSAGVSVNFLDGGGAEPLMKNMPANDKTSNFLLTHLYQYFASLLGCSKQGVPSLPAYGGHASQYQVHKFMALSNAEVTYFITQVGTAAASFGVSADDIKIVANALMSTFGMKCAPAATVIKAQGPQLQAICISDDCPEAKDATCAAYAKVVEPTKAGNGTAKPTGGATPTGTGSPTMVPTGGASMAGLSFAAVVAGIAFAL